MNCRKIEDDFWTDYNKSRKIYKKKGGSDEEKSNILLYKTWRNII